MNINKLEIGYISINKNKNNSLYIHILHQIPLTTADSIIKSDLNGLYNDKYDILSKEIRTIYNISSKYNILCTLLINGYNNTQSIAHLTNKQTTEMIHIKVSNNNNKTHIHDALPSSSKVTPFELITSGSEGDFDEEFVNQMLDSKRKQMSSNPSTLMVNNNKQLPKSPSIIAVTPMGDNNESDSSSTTVYNNNNNNNEDTEPDLPSDEIEKDEEINVVEFQ
eukprot:14587_1